MNLFADREVPVRARPAQPKANKDAEIVILRRKELGNNCKFIADAYPGMAICQAADVPNTAKFIVRWGTTSNLPERARGMDKRTIINEAKAIHGTSDKQGFRVKMAAAGLSPRTWTSLAALQKEEEVGAVIVRPSHHERSEGLYVCDTLDKLNAAIAKCKDGYYISEYIPKEREVRVFVVSGKALMVFEKRPKNKKDVSWGCVEEGSLDYVRWSEWPVEAVATAIKAFNLSELDFGAVDVIIKGKNAYALEINTAPEVWPYYGERLADAFKYIVKHGKDRLKVKNYADWHDMIHPCLEK